MNDAKKHYKSKFDYDPSFGTDSSGGDIVYKILGIESNDELVRVPSILISKKTRCDPDADAIEEEPPDDFETPDGMGKLRNLLEQEDSRGDEPLSTPTTLRDKMKRIRTTSKNLLNKKVTQVKLMSSSNKNSETKDFSMHESHSDISLYKPSVSLRESAAELGSSILQKVKRQRPRRPQNDGVGMATLLVRSMMAAPSLDSIAENTDTASAIDPLKPAIDAKDSGSMISLPNKKNHHPHIENKLNISVGDSIIDLKASDGNLSDISISSATISESSSEDDELLGDEVVMIDADTISM